MMTFETWLINDGVNTSAAVDVRYALEALAKSSLRRSAMFIEPGLVNSCTPLGVLCVLRKELVLGFTSVP